MDPLDVVIVGGCGHVGLPLALSLADSGYRLADDIDKARSGRVLRGSSVPGERRGEEPLPVLPRRPPSSRALACLERQTR
jgi:glycine/D-amino acid oxidase-like deaminating enzyme